MNPRAPLGTPRRQRRLLTAALALAAVLGCAPTGSADLAGKASLTNPGFDLPAQNALPPGWSLEAAVRDKGRVELAANYPGATGQVLALHPNDRNTGDKPLGVGQLLDASAFRGRTVTVTARLAATGGATAVVGVHALGKGGDLGFVQLTQGSRGDALAQHSRALSVPAGADMLVVYAIATGTTGRAVFDAVNVSAQAAAPAPAAAAVTPAAPAAAEITVDARRTIRQVPPAVFGTNVEWIFDGQGLWSKQLQALDPQAVRLAKELAPTVIRFPGGVFSDTYHWRDGVGPQAGRPTTPNHPGGPKSRHVFGSQEAAQLARDIGAELLITVNAGSGTAQEAADWVAYAARDMRPKPRWWEVGNELYMKGDLSGGAMSASQYAGKYLAYAAAMRAADPAIRIGAIGGLNHGSYRFIADDRWTETVLKQAAGQIDFLAIHNAYAPVAMGVKDGADPRSVYTAMLAAPRQIEANLQEVSRLLQRYETPARPIGIAVTEWGPFFHVLPGSAWVDHVKTMGSALFVASTLNVFLRSPRVELANFFKLADHGFMGWLGRRGGAWVDTAPGLAFRLYRHALLGRTLVQSTVVSPTFSSNGVGAVNAQADVPWVDAVASYDEGVLVLLVVNKSDRQAFDGRIALPGVRSFGGATITTLSADGWDANTGTELPRIPGLEWARQVDLGRFGKGAPGEIRLAQEQVPGGTGTAAQAATLTWRLRPASISAIRLERVELTR